MSFFYTQIPASVISSVGSVSISAGVLSSSNSLKSSSNMANPSAQQTFQRANVPATMCSSQPRASGQTVLPTQVTVRKLPKKRKFDPSELEEIERSCANNNGLVTVAAEFQPQNQVIQEHRRSVSPIQNNSGYPCVDLSEWSDYRVLAKQRGLYLPGVIKQADRGRVVVELDGPESESVVYGDIFGVQKYDIIGDASPPVNQVERGSRCVVRTTDRDNSVQNIFVEGVVFDVLNTPIRFRVKVSAFSFF